MMKKFTALFDGTTIINFQLYIILMKRYKKGSLLFGFLVFFLILSIYHFQVPLNWTSVKLTETETSDATSTPYSLVAGNKKRSTPIAEIMVLRRSVDFNLKVAEKLLAQENFKDLDFHLGFFPSNKMTGTKISENCKGELTCVTQKVSRLIPQFYSITDPDRRGNNFVVEVKSVTAETASTILQAIIESIKEARIESMKKYLDEQILKTSKTLQEKKEELTQVNYLVLSEEKAAIENELREMEIKLDIQNRLMTEQQATLSKMESQIKSTTTILKRKVSQSELSIEKRRDTLREKINSLTADIHSLEISKDSVGSNRGDSEVLKELKISLDKATKELTSLGTSDRSFQSVNAFQKSSDEKNNITELDYSTYKDHLSRSTELYNELVAKKQLLITRKMELSDKVDAIKPLIEISKTLETRLLQLNVQKMSSVTNIIFDENPSAPDAVKRLSKILTVAYFVLLLFTVLFSFLTFRFIYDPLIHDENDINRIFGKNAVLGEVPRF